MVLNLNENPDLNQVNSVAGAGNVENHDARQENLDTRVSMLVKQAEKLQSVFKTMKPDDPNFLKFADFINPVLQLRELWPNLNENEKGEFVTGLEALQKDF
jgi:hypothetical protein